MAVLPPLSPAGTDTGGEATLPDPMQPPQVEAASTAKERKPHPSWRLQSILVSPARRVAIINGHRLTTGERVGGARLVSIHPDHVILNYQGRNLELRLPLVNLKKSR